MCYICIAHVSGDFSCIVLLITFYLDVRLLLL